MELTSTIGACFTSFFSDAATAQSCETGTETSPTATAALPWWCLLLVLHLLYSISPAFAPAGKDLLLVEVGLADSTLLILSVWFVQYPAELLFEAIIQHVKLSK